MDCGESAVVPAECITFIDTTEGVSDVLTECRISKDTTDGVSEVVPIECIISIDTEGASDGSVADAEALGTTEIQKAVESYAECLICQEEDDINNLESPCGCCGSVKYAHSKCVQRWCNEKGNTICEICHETYRNGYHVKTLPQSDLIRSPFDGQWGIIGSDPLQLPPPEVLVLRPTEEDISSIARRVFVWILAGILVGGLASTTVLAVMILPQLLARADHFTLFTHLFLGLFEACGLLLLYSSAARALEFFMILSQLLAKADHFTLFTHLFLGLFEACGLLHLYSSAARALELERHERRWRLQQGPGGSFPSKIAMVNL